MRKKTQIDGWMEEGRIQTTAAACKWRSEDSDKVKWVRHGEETEPEWNGMVLHTVLHSTEMLAWCRLPHERD